MPKMTFEDPKLYTVTLTDGSGDQDLPAEQAFPMIEAGTAKFTNPRVGTDQEDYEAWIETRKPA